MWIFITIFLQTSYSLWSRLHGMICFLRCLYHPAFVTSSKEGVMINFSNLQESARGVVWILGIGFSFEFLCRTTIVPGLFSRTVLNITLLIYFSKHESNNNINVNNLVLWNMKKYLLIWYSTFKWNLIIDNTILIIKIWYSIF